jgi:hypothetical protein
MIGTRTIATASLLAFALATAFAFGTFARERLVTRGFGTLLAIGVFGIVVGTLVFRFFRMGDRSRHYLRWATEKSGFDVSEGHFVGGEVRRVVIGANHENEAADLPSWASLLASITVASVLALAVDGRALSRLGRASGEMPSMASSYCSDDREAPSQARDVRDVNEPGCELVRRAFALGYTKSLGTCSLKRNEVVASHKPECTRRQRDEPWLHYSYRLLARALDSLRGTARAAYFTKAFDDFRARAQHLGALRLAELEMLTSSPHASHHIWTTLADPGNGAFQETSCSSRYARLPHRATPSLASANEATKASLVFEHIVAQLLFEGTYATSAGRCREYHVHWGAPASACADLAANPESFLAQNGVLADVRRALGRFHVANELVALGQPKPTLEPSAFISFQCYVESASASRENESRAQSRTTFTVDGNTFSADEVRVGPSPADADLYVDRYYAVARLLARGFHYGHLMSEVGIDKLGGGGPTRELEMALAGPDYLLSRLYELESIDIYLDPGFLAHRPDLLEIYPYERHLKNYVEVFRHEYRRDRGRL